ncbi:MAG: TolC family protein [Planctomycetota bacterium]
MFSKGLWIPLLVLILFPGSGCVSDLLFGVSDSGIEACLQDYKNTLRREVARETILPDRVTPKKKTEVKKAPKPGEALVLDLANAIALATCGRLKPGHAKAHLLVGRRMNEKAAEFAQKVRTGDEPVAGNSGFLSQVENLRRSIISLKTAEHEWDPQISGTVSYVFSNAYAYMSTSPQSESSSGSVSFGVSQKLPLGGTVSLSTGASYSQDPASTANRSAGVSLSGSISQPLLRGFGPARAREGIRQARRGMVASIRSFELYRQGFTINVMQQYYNLIRQRHVVKNNRRAYEQALFLYQQTKELYDRLGEKTTLDVLRAELSEQQAKDTLDEAQRSWEETLDSFKEFLGLDPSVEIELKDERPAFKVVDFDPLSAENAALNNRLDLRNSLQSLEDAFRQFRFAREDLSLPSLDLSLGASLSHPSAKDFNEILLKSHSLSASLSLAIPLDRIGERNALRSSLISLKQQVRSFNLEIESIRREVKNAFRNLRRLTRSIRNQKRQIEISERREKKAFMDFKEGQISNRDLVEAQEELRNMENGLIQTQVDYEIARVGLLRDLGILDLDEFGCIVESP